MTNTLRSIAKARSIFGSGVETETFLDDEGNEYLSIGGRTPELVRTIEQRERRMAMRALGADLRLLADAS